MGSKNVRNNLLKVYIQNHQTTFNILASKTSNISKKEISMKTDPTIPHPKQMTMSLMCMGLGLNDYPVPVNKHSQEYFKHRPSFDAYIYPLLKSVNPTAKHLEILTLAQAKWYEVMMTELKK